MEVKMEKFKKQLNYIGLVLLFLSLVSWQIWPYRKAIAVVFAILGAASLATYIYFNVSMLKQSFKRKSLIYSGNLFLVIILVLAILVVLNYLLARNHYRLDITEGKIHSLSDQTVKVLKNLKKDLKLTCFFREGNYSRPRMEQLLEIYAYHSKRIKSEFIDPDKNPGLVKRYGISTDGTTVLECGEKENRVTTSSEEDITNAIIKVSREQKKIIYFLEGHGESSIEETEERGYSQAKEELEKLAYEVKKLSLALSETFPQDASLLIIPGPEKDLLPNELETIKSYLSGGGRVLLMVDPEEAPGLKSFLKQYGIKLEDDLIVDSISRIMGGDYFMPIVTEYESHDITKNFRYATFFPLARSVDVLEEKPEGTKAEAIAKTSPQSWSARGRGPKDDFSFNKDKDKKGPIPVAIVATIESKKEEKGEEKEGEKEPQAEEKKEEKKPDLEKEETTEPVKKEGRLAVYGDSDFFSNNYYNLSGNGNLFLNTVNWLTEEADLISIQPRTSAPRTIQLTPSQGRLIFWTSVVILPLIVLITGISIWARRRAK